MGGSSTKALSQGRSRHILSSLAGARLTVFDLESHGLCKEISLYLAGISIGGVRILDRKW